MFDEICNFENVLCISSKNVERMRLSVELWLIIFILSRSISKYNLQWVSLFIIPRPTINMKHYYLKNPFAIMKKYVQFFPNLEKRNVWWFCVAIFNYITSVWNHLENYREFLSVSFLTELFQGKLNVNVVWNLYSH